MRQNKKGFTIVELLIVIVVIAILAAIGLVSYGSVQDRAARSATMSAVSSYATAVKLYAAEKGRYPAYTNACLGGSQNTNNRCYRVNDATSTCSSAGAAYGNASFDAEIRPYMGGALAVPSQNSYMCGGAPYAGALYYADNPTVNASLYVILRAATGPCPSIGHATVQNFAAQDEIRICRYILPSL